MFQLNYTHDDVGDDDDDDGDDDDDDDVVVAVVRIEFNAKSRALRHLQSIRRLPRR